MRFNSRDVYCHSSGVIRRRFSEQIITTLTNICLVSAQGFMTADNWTFNRVSSNLRGQEAPRDCCCGE
ncbi:unnamed protein product [Allacma fusca]|uniref:Uncharacterized protein n=1 Tax=Allacma fusca TaxID=39272 RepID=A0A8J2LRP9_9HEXA|nr:unnamed protein product [Allacma fusca]